MKYKCDKIGVLLLSIIMYLCYFFSFAGYSIYNEDLEIKEAFSLQNLDFYISSSTNDSVELSYDMVSTNSSELTEEVVKTLYPITCNVEGLQSYCVKDSFKNYMQLENTTFSSSQIFVFKQLGNVKEVSIDFIAPTITTFFEFDEDLKQIEFEVNVSDDLDFGVETEVEIFTVLNDEKLYVYNLTTSKEEISDSFEVEQGGEYELYVTAKDYSGNWAENEDNFGVEDEFGPIVSNIEVQEDKEGNIEISFDIEDESDIYSWQFNSQTKIFGEIFDENKSKQFVKTEYVFDKKTVTIITRDVLGNEEKMSYTLPSSISISASDKIGDTLKITAKGADSCEIISGISKDDLTKSGDVFSLDVKESSQGEYDVIVECENEKMSKEAVVSFEIDRTPPEIEAFNAIARDDGFIELEFEYEEDVEEILVFRNEKRIKTLDNGNKKFVDKNVDFPNPYDYYIELTDEAGNEGKSEVMTVVPKKVDILFDVTSQDLNESTKIVLVTEKGVKGIISPLGDLSQIENSKGIVFKMNEDDNVEFETLGDFAEFEVMRQSSDVVMDFFVKDSFNNSKSEQLLVLKALGEKRNESLEALEAQKLSEIKESERNIVLYLLYFLLLVVILVAIVFGIREALLLYAENRGNDREDTKKSKTKSKGSDKDTITKSNSFFDKEVVKRIKEKKVRELEKKKVEEELQKKSVLQHRDELSEYKRSKYRDLNRRAKSKISEDDRNEEEFIANKSEHKKRSSSHFQLFPDNIISRIFLGHTSRNEKKDTIIKETKKVKGDMFSTWDTSKFKYSNMANIKENKKGVEKVDAKEVITALEDEKRKDNGNKRKKVESEVNTSTKEENVVKKDKYGSPSQVKWGDYLDKRAQRSKRWYIAQKEVEHETRL